MRLLYSYLFPNEKFLYNCRKPRYYFCSEDQVYYTLILLTGVHNNELLIYIELLINTAYANDYTVLSMNCRRTDPPNANTSSDKVNAFNKRVVCFSIESCL